MFLRLLLFSCFLSLAGLNAQAPQKRNYYVKGYLEFKNGTTIYEQPFIGGFNSTQFQSMDINNDGAMDLICFEKSENKILPFIRTSGDLFRYAPEYEAYFPPGFYYYKTADLNADNKPDIFTLDETSSLIIHKNITQPTDSFPRFQNLGPMIYRNQYVYPAPILYNQLSLSKTDLPEITDVDGDGDLDILTYDQGNQVYRLYEDVRSDYGWSKDTFEFQIMDICFGYFNDFNNTINLNDCPYKDKLKPRHSGGASVLMFDNDKDGDLEVVQSNIGSKHMTFIKNGKKDFTWPYDSMISFDTIFPRNTVRACSYDFPAGFLAYIDADTIKDLVTAPNGFSDVKETNQLWYYRNFGKNNEPDFRFQKDNFLQDKTLDLGARTAPAFADYDADGDMDLFIANNGDFDATQGLKDRIALFKNTGKIDSPRYEFVTNDYLGITSRKMSELIVRFGDVDGDKDVDMLLGERTGKVSWYRNSAGVGNPFSLTLEDSNFVTPPGVFGATNSAPEIFNFNQDSLPDLLVGYYYGGVKLLVNDGTISKPKYTAVAGNAWGMRGNEFYKTDNDVVMISYGYAVPVVADVDLDGNDDILIGTAFGRIRLYHPYGRPTTDSLSADTGWLWQLSKTDSMVPDFGARIVPAVVNLDKDSLPEIVIGNSRGGLHIATGKGSTVGKDAVVKFDPPKFSLYPNPATDMLVLERKNSGGNWQIRIYNITGSTLYASKILAGESALGIRLPEIPNGIYLLEAINGNVRSVQKFSINRN